MALGALPLSTDDDGDDEPSLVPPPNGASNRAVNEALGGPVRGENVPIRQEEGCNLSENNRDALYKRFCRALDNPDIAHAEDILRGLFSDETVLNQYLAMLHPSSSEGFRHRKRLLRAIQLALFFRRINDVDALQLVGLQSFEVEGQKVYGKAVSIRYYIWTFRELFAAVFFGNNAVTPPPFHDIS